MKNLKRIFPIVFFALLSAVPGFETSAQGNPRLFSEILVLKSIVQIHGAQATWQATSGNGNYGTLQNLHQAGFIDGVLAGGEKYGYVYVLTTTPWSPSPPTGARFTLTATPRAYRKTGVRSFFIDEFGEIRGGDRNGQPATAGDPYIDFDPCTNGGLADNERCTIESLRTLHGAESTFYATHGNGNYGTLQQLRDAWLIPRRWETGIFRGYSFSISISPATNQTPATFRISAVPQIYGVTGRRSFFIATDGVIYAADRNGGPASENDPPLEDCFDTNERCAIGSMYLVHGAEMSYLATTGRGNYGSLSQLLAERFIGPVLASGVKDGYIYNLTIRPATKTQVAYFNVTAVPQQYGVTGTRSFFVDVTGVVRGADRQGGPANENDPPANY